MDSLKIIFFIVVLIISSSFKNPDTVNKGNLKIVVNNIRNSKGQIVFCLYNLKENFPYSEKAMFSSFVKVNGNTAECTFMNIEMGTYAVSVFHDEDNNRQINSNFIGIPKEGVGASNNAKGHMGPPKYEDAKFDFNMSEQIIKITLTYL